MRNRAIKISISMPINLLEKLDKITTYKGKSRSKYVCGAVSQRIEARRVDNMDALPISYLASMLNAHDECPEYLRVLLQHYMKNAFGGNDDA